MIEFRMVKINSQYPEVLGFWIWENRWKDILHPICYCLLNDGSLGESHSVIHQRDII